ncbi:MAG: S4 domain-containing protein [Candidatus Micrarchaeaceae archaeon]
MASKGNKRHIKGLNAPHYFGTPRKEHKYVVKPNAGRHSLERSIPLLLALRELNPNSNSRALVKAIKLGMVKINGKLIKDPRFPIGINDLLEIEGEGKKLTLSINERGKVELLEGETDLALLYKVVGKYKRRGGKLMVRLHDGRIVEGTNEIAVNDSVRLNSGKIEKHISMREGAECIVFDGDHAGARGVIKKIYRGTKSTSSYVTIESTPSHETFDTLMSSVMVV